jgi:hypothetical protein
MSQKEKKRGFCFHGDIQVLQSVLRAKRWGKKRWGVPSRQGACVLTYDLYIARMHIVIWPAFPQSSNLARGFFLPDPVASTLRNSKKKKIPSPLIIQFPHNFFSLHASWLARRVDLSDCIPALGWSIFSCHSRSVTQLPLPQYWFQIKSRNSSLGRNWITEMSRWRLTTGCWGAREGLWASGSHPN